jgi:hypothetical protein
VTTATPVHEDAVVTQVSIIRSEWIKLRSLRSTLWSIGLTAVVMVGLAWLVCGVRAHQFHQDMRNLAEGRPISDPVNLFIPDAVSLSLSGIILAQLVLGVLGVLVVTGEYSSRMVLATFSVVPRRLPVLLGKVAVFAVVIGIVVEIASVVAFLVGQAALSSTGHGATWSSIGAPRAIFGGGLYLVLVGLMGLGLGFALRSTAGAIGTLMGLMLVMPLLVAALPSPYDENIRKILPMIAGTQIIQTPYRDPSMLAPWAGLGVMALWSLGALVLGAFVLQKRDC